MQCVKQVHRVWQFNHCLPTSPKSVSITPGFRWLSGLTAYGLMNETGKSRIISPMGELGCLIASRAFLAFSSLSLRICEVYRCDRWCLHCHCPCRNAACVFQLQSPILKRSPKVSATIYRFINETHLIGYQTSSIRCSYQFPGCLTIAASHGSTNHSASWC